MNLREIICLPAAALFYTWRSTRIHVVLLAAAVLLTSSLEIPAVALDNQQVHVEDSATSKTRNNDYVGSAACATCHADLYISYEKTDMGKSMSEITPAILEKLNLPATYYDQKLNRHYDVYAKDGKLYQSEFELDADSREVFRSTQPLAWITGSGANIYGGIIQRDDGYLFEAPMSLYTKPMSWGTAPGYEFTDLGFNRPILEGCIFCHVGRANPVPATNGQYAKPPFSQLTIGCENCHGPGAAHVLAMSRATHRHSNNLAIVNPARLSADSANNICMECHEIGDERILQPGKTYKDIRPGVPLDNILSVLMVPPSRKSPPQSDHLQQYYSMTLSKCYRASGGQLRCITCHDPHVQPSAQEAPDFYNKKCLTCHTDQSCSLPLAARHKEALPDNCIGCHMPQRSVGFIAHTSLTNHRIVTRPDEPFPDVMFEQTIAALPDLIHLDPAPGKKNEVPPSLTLLQAYAELAAYKPEYVAPYFRTLDHLSRTEPANAMVQAGLGNRDLSEGKSAEAMAHFQTALRIGPQRAEYYAGLSAALEKLGRREEALSVQQKAIAHDPYNPILQRKLVQLFIQMQQYSNAQKAINHYLEIFPQDSYMRQIFTNAMRQASSQ